MNRWMTGYRLMRRIQPLLLVCFALAFLARPLSAGATDWTTTSATASSALWAVSNVYDGDTSTNWSTTINGTAQNNAWLAFWFDATHNVNYVKLATRFDGTSALGFPVEFSVYWSDGTNWNFARGFTHYTRPTSQWVTLTLPSTVSATGIYITAKVLGDDKSGNYVFQLAEAKGGYDASQDGTEYTPNSATVSTAYSGWPATNLYDNNTGTAWSSSTHTSASNTEWLAYWWSAGMQSINYVKLMPRYSGSNALGFPVTFTVYYSNGSSWVSVGTYTSYPTPYRGDWIILPFPSTVTADGIHIVASTLGKDDVNNYVFQVAEAKAGYNPGFTRFSFVSNDASSGRNEIRNVGSEAINRADQLGQWNFDTRGIVIAPASGTYRNIYAPQAVQTSTNNWNIYFGGWDGSSSQNDRLYMTTTSDNFLNFGAHSLKIDKGVYIHVNNDCTLKVGTNSWRMVYTTYANNGYNKPCYATSTDGSTWTPSAGSTAYLLNMIGYSNWSTADVNGGNVVFKDASGTWHMYFNNFNDWPGVQHATSSNCIDFNYVGKASNDGAVMNDFKAFDYGGTRYYIGAYHMNGPNVYMSIGTDLNTLPALSVPFTYNSSDDRYIVAPCLVQDGSRVYGMLYGAGADSGLASNRIFARWLQKKVIFKNASVQWGDVEQAYGPDRIRLFMGSGQNVETGRFYVYDTDGSTLLYVSPTVTMRAGDIWNYTAGY